ncbi:MAG: LPP20 family lipoprotein [Pseudomonadota bacterium]|nr:LPP20 family lipoprotein [Pseudomonadota bacterium]
MPILKLLMVVFALVANTLAVAASPDWISAAPKKYPNSAYLIGRGIGSTATEAQDRARGDLVAIFEVRVEVATGSNTTVTRTGKGEQVSKVSTQTVSTKTDKVIGGINIADVWRDPETSDFHALAVLSRAQAAASLKEEIGKIDTAVQLEMDKAKTATDPLLKIGALARAMETATKRDGFQASLKAIDPSGRGVEAAIPQTVIRSQLDDAIKEVKVSSAVEEDGGVAEFASILKGGLAASGFLAQGAAKADFVLVGKLNLDDLGRRDNWNWMRGTLEIALIEKESGRVRGSKTWPIKAAAQNATTARKRVLIEAEKLLKRELKTIIIEFATS